MVAQSFKLHFNALLLSIILTAGLSSARAESKLCSNAFISHSELVQQSYQEPLAELYASSRDEYFAQRKAGVALEKIEIELTEQIGLNIFRMSEELRIIQFAKNDSKLSVYEKRRTALIASLKKLSKNPNARINYLNYLDLASQYAMLMGKASNLPGGHAHEDTIHYMKSSFSSAKGFRRDLENVLERTPDLFAIPEFRSLDLPNFNDLIGEDIWVLGLSDRVQDVDGKLGGPDWFFYHDINHLILRASAYLRYPLNESDSTYRSNFKKWMSSETLVETDRILAEVFWFYAHHESSAPLNRESLLYFIDHLSDYQLNEVFKIRTRFSPLLESVSLAEMRNLLSSVRAFADSKTFSKMAAFHGDRDANFVEVKGGFYFIKNGVFKFVSDRGNQSTVVSLFDPSHAGILKRQIGEARFNQIEAASNRESLALEALKESRVKPTRTKQMPPSNTFDALVETLIQTARDSAETNFSGNTSKTFALEDFRSRLELLTKEGLLFEPLRSHKNISTLTSKLTRTSSLQLQKHLVVDIAVSVQVNQNETLLVPFSLLFEKPDYASLHADIRELADSAFKDSNLQRMGIYNQVIHLSGGALLIEKRKTEPFARYLELSREDYRRGGYEELTTLPDDSRYHRLDIQN